MNSQGTRYGRWSVDTACPSRACEYLLTWGSKDRGKMTLKIFSDSIYKYFCLRKEVDFGRESSHCVGKSVHRELWEPVRKSRVSPTLWLYVFRRQLQMNCDFRSSSKLNFSTNVRVLKYLSHQGLKGFNGALKIMLNFFLSVKLLWKTSFKFLGSDVMRMADAWETNQL